jgi:hypothetical protein
MKWKGLILILSMLILILNMTNEAYASEDNCISINTSYPLVNDSINLPKDSMELDISVTSDEVQSVQFYYSDYEDDMDNKKLVLEDNNSSDGFSCSMPFQEDEAFSRTITIQMTLMNGTTTTREFAVFKEITSTDY